MVNKASLGSRSGSANASGKTLLFYRLIYSSFVPAIEAGIVGRPTGKLNCIHQRHDGPVMSSQLVKLRDNLSLRASVRGTYGY